MNHNPLQREKREVVPFGQRVEEILVLLEIENLPAFIANEVIMIIPDPVIMNLVFDGNNDDESLLPKPFENPINRRKAQTKAILFPRLINRLSRGVIIMGAEVISHKPFLDGVAFLIGNHFHL